jgi:osmoprotectant transport system ATP-binding protein
MIVEVKHVYKKYNKDLKVLEDLSLSIEEGEFITILGPSGCGKTTLLKMINQLIDFDSGDIIIKGKSIKDWDTITLRRNIGYVIQQIGLFPHMNIENNISYVLSLEGLEGANEDKEQRN